MSGRRLQLGTRPAVLVVDLTHGFTDPASPLGCDLTSEVQATRAVVDAARARRFPVLFTTVAFGPAGNDGGIWPQKIPAALTLASGSRWVDVDPRLDRRPDEPLIVKKGPSAFFGTPLASLLVAERVDTVVLCGTTTSGCIRATAIDLVQHGYPALVPRECVGDRARAPHDANLADIDAQYGDVVPAAEALAFLEAAAR
jgi:N-formylmaleamate deformylase